jgi:hypothetical protein
MGLLWILDIQPDDWKKNSNMKWRIRIYCHVTESDYRRILDCEPDFIIHFDIARDYTSEFTITHTLLSTATSSLPLLDSGFQQWMFSFLWVPKLSPASEQNFSSIIAVETCLFAELLPKNGCCIVAYFTVIA